MKKLLLLLFLIPNLVMGEEVLLVCNGKSEHVGWYNNSKLYKESFEIIFDETLNTFSLRGMGCMKADEELKWEKFTINKDFITYECDGVNSDESSFVDSEKGGFTINRISGRIEWNIYRTSKYGGDDSLIKKENYTVLGAGECKSTTRAF